MSGAATRDQSHQLAIACQLLNVPADDDLRALKLLEYFPIHLTYTYNGDFSVRSDRSQSGIRRALLGGVEELFRHSDWVG